MSTDYFLYSPSLKRDAMIGSIGMSGTKVWSSDKGVVDFLRYIIDNNIKDAVIIDEHRLAVEEERLREEMGIDEDNFDEVIQSWNGAPLA